MFCDAYGIEADLDLVEATIAAVGDNVDRLRSDRRQADAEWWQKQLDWLRHHRGQLEEAVSAT